MDYDFLPASDGTGDAAKMTVQNLRASGDPTIVVDTVGRTPAKFIGTYGHLLPTGLIDPTTKRDFKGHISAGKIIIDAMEPGNVDNGNSAGDVVIIKPNTGWTNRVAKFIKDMTGLGTPEHVTVGGVTNSGDYNQTGGSVTFPSNSVAPDALAAGIPGPKIDFTTFKDQTNSMPHKTTSVAMGFSLGATLTRVGNLVTIHMNATTSSVSVGDPIALGEQIPAGYRPLSGQQAVLAGIASIAGSSGQRLGWEINSDGSMGLHNGVAITNATRINGSSSWFTADAWPA